MERICDLPRPVLINELQERIGSLTGSADPRAPPERSIVCHSCRLVARKADVYCYQCRKQLCRKCEEKHGKVGSFRSHKVVTLSASLFCAAHPDETVLHYCHQCETGVCSTCLMDEHEGHRNDDIETLARAGEHTLRMRLEEADQSEGGKKTAIADQQVKDMRGKVIQARDDFWDAIRGIKTSMKEFDGKLETLARDFHTKSASALKEIDGVAEEVGESVERQATVRARVSYLLEKASMPELVMATRSMEAYTTLGNGYHGDASISLPVVDQKMAQIATFMPKLERRLEVDTKTLTIDYDAPVSPLAVEPRGAPLTGEYTLEYERMLGAGEGWNPTNITLDTDQCHVVILGICDTGSAIITLFSYQGELVKGMNLDPDVAASGNIAIDTQRGLYILPCTDGQVVRVNRSGEVKDRFKVGESLYDVCYFRPFDLYAFSEVKSGRALVIDASSRRSMCKCTAHNHPDELPVAFGNQFYVDLVLWRKCLHLVVCDHFNHRVQLFDARGQHVASHGKEGSQDGEFFYPSGACVDPAGNLLVCDSMNRRVMGLGGVVEVGGAWESPGRGAEKGKDDRAGRQGAEKGKEDRGGRQGSWLCILGKDELCRETNADLHGVAMDVVNGMLAVYVEKKEINLFKMAK